MRRRLLVNQQIKKINASNQSYFLGKTKINEEQSIYLEGRRVNLTKKKLTENILAEVQDQ